MKKYGPKENLIEGQEYNINNMFYRDYMTDYFEGKITALINILSEKEEYFDRLKSKRVKIGLLEYEVSNELDMDKIKKQVKCEIVETYYHCLETFIRLFISHAKLEKCPLIELTALKISEYHKKIDDLAEGNFEGLNDKFDGEDTILLVLMGCTKLDKKVDKKVIKNLKEWIVFCANELKKINQYNSFKHGLSMFAGFGSIRISNPKIKDEIFKEGDAIHALKIENSKKQYKFSVSNIFIDSDYKAALILMYSELIENIITVGKIRYVTNDYKMRLGQMHFTKLSYNELNKLMKRDNLIEGYSKLLIYKDDIKIKNHEEVSSKK